MEDTMKKWIGIILALSVVLQTGCIQNENIKEEEIDINTEEETTVTENSNSDTINEERFINYEESLYYLMDENVENNDVFVSFVRNEISAYDASEKKDMYLRDYYEKYLSKWLKFYGVQMLAEDLNNDGANELLVLLQYDSTDGYLLVFHEENGQLVAWEKWEEFLEMHYMEIKLYGNGTFSLMGSSGRIYGHYDSSGKIENILTYYQSLEPIESGKAKINYSLIQYEERKIVKELSYSGIDDGGEWIVTGSDKEIEAECNRILEELHTQLIEERRIRTNYEYNENAEIITLEELMGI